MYTNNKKLQNRNLHLAMQSTEREAYKNVFIQIYRY